MITEIWKQINGCSLYEVSNFGRVKSLPRKTGNGFNRGEIILKNHVGKIGYPTVAICFDKKQKTTPVHRLVAEAFVKNPKNKKTVNHKDGVKTNNFWENLEWATYSENNAHARTNGLTNSKKKVAQIKDGKILKVWESQRKAEKHFGICRGGISNCCCGRSKHAGGFKWRFV